MARANPTGLPGCAARDAMMAGVTLLLSRSDLEQVLDAGACLEVLRQCFLAAPPTVTAQRVLTDPPGPGTATAVLDSAAVTAWRTGLAALGTHVLARPDARSVAVIGAGVQDRLPS